MANFEFGDGQYHRELLSDLRGAVILEKYGDLLQDIH
jgi:hypothetical protein